MLEKPIVVGFNINNVMSGVDLIDSDLHVYTSSSN